MKVKGLLLTAPIVLIIVHAVLYAVEHPAIAQTAPKSALEVFKSRPAWKKLPLDFLNALANKLNSVEKATEFAELCEKTGILENNIVGLFDIPGSNPEFNVGAVAATLTSYANAMGNQRLFSQAKQGLELALLLNPRHAPAWASMALVAINMGDCKAAVNWANKVIAFRPDPNSNDPWEYGGAQSMTPKGEKRAAEALGEPEMIGAWKQVQEQMKAIKNACGK